MIRIILGRAAGNKQLICKQKQKAPRQPGRGGFLYKAGMDKYCPSPRGALFVDLGV
jgi:hypothetical protein